MIYLPALPGNMREEPTVEPEVTGADIAPTILLVEDDHDVRAYVVEILRELTTGSWKRMTRIPRSA